MRRRFAAGTLFVAGLAAAMITAGQGHQAHKPSHYVGGYYCLVDSPLDPCPAPDGATYILIQQK